MLTRSLIVAKESVCDRNLPASDFVGVRRMFAGRSGWPGPGRVTRYRTNAGASTAAISTPTTTSPPPPAAAIVVPTAAAAAPCTASARRGPPATTTVNTPCSRPRTSSDAACCRIVLRNADDTMSAAPPTAKNTNAIQSMVPACRRQTAGDPEADHRHAPHQDRDDDGKALTLDPR